MKEKEFNLAILKELKRIANEVFAKVKVSKEGTYTAAELWNGKNSFGENIIVSYENVLCETYTAKIGTFSFQVSAQDVFLRLWKFEQLCRVRQENKARFTYGVVENEIIQEKAMYYTGQMERGYYDENNGCSPVIGEGNYKVVTRKVTLKKLSEKVAEDKKGRVFYKCNGLWYNISNGNSATVIGTIKRKPDYIMDSLSKYDFSIKNEWTTIYKALYDAMKSEREKYMPEERKSENEPEKAVICESEKIDTSAKELNKHEALKATEKMMREKHPNYIALIRYNGMYYSYGESAKEVRFANGVLDYITDTGDYICFPESLLDDVLPKLIKAGHGVITCDIIEGEQQQEDYPPEPYNEADTGNMERPYDEPSCKEIDHERPVFSHTETSANSWGNGCPMLPNYLRQKVFPTELFNARRKIRRFKPRYFIVYTNYHLCKESALERERISNTSVYRVLIRGET